MSGGVRGRLDASERATSRAWEAFAAGEPVSHGVRPEILGSWVRCRDDFGIEPTRDRALPADAEPALAPEESVVAAELGAAAMSIATEIQQLSGVVVVADGRGRLLSAWGDESAARRGREQNLGPLYSWAEHSTGTTGVGTALVSRGPIAVRRFEHWCEAFHDWSCAAVAVRSPDGRPVGVVGVSLWGRPLPATAPTWLASAAGIVERRLATRAAASRAATPPTLPVARVTERIVGQRGGRTVVLPVEDVEVVTLADGLVWLETGEGRLRAAASGLEQLEHQLGPAGFLRVSRAALVNLHRVRELAPAVGGGLRVLTKGGHELAVSRRRVAALRAALGI